jgi:glycosyltransferase involved in cell wall biosynthesis
MTEYYKRLPQKISIVIATLNSDRWLERCLKSICCQDYEPKEIIVKDGGSVDRTLEIVREYERHINFWVSNKDNGIYDAWNSALEKCSGDWVCFIGSDDYFVSHTVLSEYAEFLKTVPQHCRIVYAINKIINSKDELLYTIGKPWNEIESTFLETMSLPHPGLMHHQSLFEEIGLFNNQYKIAGDYEFLLRALKNQSPIFWPRIVCATPIGGISTLPKNNLICLSEIRRAKISNGIKGVSFISIMQLVSAILRFVLWQAIGEKQSRFLLDALRKIRGLDPFWSRAI